MRRVDLPGGQWADLRDKEEITTRGRRGIQSIAAALMGALPKLQNAAEGADMTTIGFTEAEMDATLRMEEASVVAFLAGWSLDKPLPTLDTVGDLPVALYDALSQAVAKDAAELSLDTSPGGDGTPDPKELSGASEPSDGPSKVAPEQSPPTLT